MHRSRRARLIGAIKRDGDWEIWTVPLAGDRKPQRISSKEFNKDKLYEHLNAKQRAIMRAIAAIDASVARNEHRKEAAAEQADPAPAAPKEKKPQKEKPEKAEKAAPSKTGD
jgi:hypothetical protein